MWVSKRRPGGFLHAKSKGGGRCPFMSIDVEFVSTALGSSHAHTATVKSEIFLRQEGSHLRCTVPAASRFRPGSCQVSANCWLAPSGSQWHLRTGRLVHPQHETAPVTFNSRVPMSQPISLLARDSAIHSSIHLPPELISRFPGIEPQTKPVRFVHS